MPTQPNKFDEFLRQVAPLMPLYKSLEFACVAAWHGSEWILISGKAVLSTEPCASEAQIVPVVKLQEIVALKGRIPAKRVKDLVADLRESWVVRDLEEISVRLTAKGARGYSWGLPEVISVDKSWNPSSRWYRALELNGNGPDPSSLLSYSTLREIDSQLCRRTAYNGFDRLCEQVGLPVRQSNLTSSFQVAAELPAGVLRVDQNRSKWALEIFIDFFGKPDLKVDWIPQPGMKSVRPGWTRVPRNDVDPVVLNIPDDATKADLILSFGELGEHEADVSRVEISDVFLDHGGTVIRVAPGYPGEPDHIFLKVVHKEPTGPDLANQEAVAGQQAPNTKQAFNHQNPPKLPRYRSKLKIAIFQQFIQNPKARGAIEICEGLDADGAAPPEGYKEDPEGSFYQKAYNGTDEALKRYIENSISEVRTDLHDLGWL
jgi:hypothetical protein